MSHGEYGERASKDGLSVHMWPVFYRWSFQATESIRFGCTTISQRCTACDRKRGKADPIPGFRRLEGFCFGNSRLGKIMFSKPSFGS